MEEVRITATTLTATEMNLYNNTNGAIVKTIILSNSAAIEKEVTLNIDGVTFLFKLNSKEIKIIDSPIVVNSLKAIGEGINIHISGLQL